MAHVPSAIVGHIRDRFWIVPTARIGMSGPIYRVCSCLFPQ